MVQNHENFIKKITSGKNGVTIISLVVTIVIILILAGITLNITIGEDGLISKSKEITNDIVKSEEEAQTQINSLQTAQSESLGVTNLEDTTPPSISMNILTNPVIVEVTVTETQSGLDRIEYSNDGGKTWVTNENDKTAKKYNFGYLQAGSYTIKVRAYDKNGNKSEELSQVIEVNN